MVVHSQQKDESTSNSARHNRPRWIVPLLVIVGGLIALAVYNGPRAEPNTIATIPEPTPTTHVLPTADPALAVSTATPLVDDNIVLVPTNTPEAKATAAPPPLRDLPTVTPTPIVSRQPITRTVSVSGTATLRMAVESSIFETSGQPIDVSVASRVYPFSGDSMSTKDSWCVQLGLVNLLFDLTMELNTDSASVFTQGQIHLRNDFCDAPGTISDTADVAIEIPADAAVQISYTVRGQRNLLAVSGLLDTQTDVLIELILANRRRTTL